MNGFKLFALFCSWLRISRMVAEEQQASRDTQATARYRSLRTSESGLPQSNVGAYGYYDAAPNDLRSLCYHGWWFSCRRPHRVRRRFHGRVRRLQRSCQELVPSGTHGFRGVSGTAPAWREERSREIASTGHYPTSRGINEVRDGRWSRRLAAKHYRSFRTRTVKLTVSMVASARVSARESRSTTGVARGQLRRVSACTTSLSIRQCEKPDSDPPQARLRSGGIGKPARILGS